MVENLPSAAHILKLEQNREISMAPAQGRHANSEAGVSPTPHPGGGRGRVRWGRERSFPRSSDGKESTCNAGDPVLIPASKRSAGEGIGYPL